MPLSVAAFEEPAADGAEAELWRIELLHGPSPTREALAARLAPLAERSGLARIDVDGRAGRGDRLAARTAENFPAHPIGRFWIHGAHVAGPPPDGLVPIQLDAGLAFGSGEHADDRRLPAGARSPGAAPPLSAHPGSGLRLRHSRDRRGQALAGAGRRGRQRSGRGRCRPRERDHQPASSTASAACRAKATATR